MSAAFIEKARNNFSYIILSNSESACKFAEGLKVHVACMPMMNHKWDGGICTFHELKVCSFGKCEDDADLKCDGKDYHTRQTLKCPMHSLAYEIESLSNLFTPFSNEDIQTGLRRCMFSYAFGQNTSTSRDFTIIFYPQNLHCCSQIRLTCTESVDHSIIGLLNCSGV